jgi:type IV secretory pathway VirB3-like protein
MFAIMSSGMDYRRKKPISGVTLLELIIVMGISAIIMVSVGNMIRVGVDYYFYSTAQIEVQRNALLSMSILTQELTASNFESVYSENAPNQGFVFASSLDAGGKPRRDASGNLLWAKLVCYYIGDINGEAALIRKEEVFPEPPDLSPNPPDPVALGRDVAYFMSLPTPGRLMARGITQLNTEEMTDALKITMTAEINEGRNWLEMDVDTTIVPRN